MNINHDFQIDIATAHSRLSKKWKNRKWKWSELAERCSRTRRTNESQSEYLRMSREEQSDIKDVGGFVGGYLNGGLRKTASVLFRSIATLDIDYGTPDVWEDFTTQFGFAALLYSTHKHTKEKPRYRLVFPLSRNVKPDEYEPLCRKIAESIGIDMFDITTYQLPRLFYWPSTSRDGEFVFEIQDGPACDVDEILGQYVDFRDVSCWPLSSREGEAIAHGIRKAGDPLEKPGVIGAFCRAYPIEDAIDKFLADVYEPTATDGRYTYRKGSVAGGLVCYEGKFAYSYHETDPASRQLCNAFDLCRIHLFGIYDEGSRATDITRMPSYLKMQEFAAKDGKVAELLTKERLASIQSDFAEVEIIEDGKKVPVNTEWMQKLECTKAGDLKPTMRNIIRILENDPLLSGHLWHDQFSGFDIVEGGLPWDRSATQWGNRDDANLRVYFDERYGITSKDKIKDAKESVLTKNRKHPIRDYLNGLVWDGKNRLDTLIIDYIGAEDNELNRAMTRKQFTAAVARVMNPGCKYDYCLIMSGPEGIGKSTLCSVMGGEWFSDSLYTMEDKAGMEQIRGGWVIELPELGGMKRSEVEQVKAYITRQSDNYRPAYGTVMERHPRQCVFFGTTNETYFLKGDTGNRRFWVISVNPDLRKVEDTRKALEADRDQLWAEAVWRYREGEQLYLPMELEKQARSRQDEFSDNNDDPLPDMVHEFLDMKLPANWGLMTLPQRRNYLSNDFDDPLRPAATEQRTVVCAAEFICEMLRRSREDKEYKYLARKVSKIIENTPGWEKVSSSKHVARLYGIQRAYRRVLEVNVNDDI